LSSANGIFIALSFSSGVIGSPPKSFCSQGELLCAAKQ
jgi:hypothetical protein